VFSNSLYLLLHQDEEMSALGQLKEKANKKKENFEETKRR
jgi:hypothetical protein